MSYSASDIADYFLACVDEDAGDNISNLKLNKLLYYAQGFHLAIRTESLFPEGLFAWVYGPVVPEVYHRYKDHGANALPAPTQFDFERYEPVMEILDDVYDVYGQFSAAKLVEMTHREPPWSQTPLKHRIRESALRDYFATLVRD